VNLCNTIIASLRYDVSSFSRPESSLSHTSHDSVCCKDDLQSLWKKANFDPQPTKNPWTDYHQIRTAWLRRGPLLPKKLGSIRRGVFAPI